MNTIDFEQYLNLNCTNATDDICAKRNILLHAICGGIDHVDDKLGKIPTDLLELISFDDGKILSLSDNCAPTDDSEIINTSKLKKLFKIRNTFDSGATVAAFNLYEKNESIRGTVSALDAGLKDKKSYMYYEYFTGEFGYVNADECIDVELRDNNTFRYYTFIKKSHKDYLFLGRIDKLNSRVAVVSENESGVELYEGGKIAFVSEEDYAVFDEEGNEIECERYGILMSGCCDRKNKILRFVKYDS